MGLQYNNTVDYTPFDIKLAGYIVECGVHLGNGYAGLAGELEKENHTNIKYK